MTTWTVTSSQARVLDELVKVGRYAEVASALGLSVKTVEHYAAGAMYCMGAANVVMLALTWDRLLRGGAKMPVHDRPRPQSRTSAVILRLARRPQGVSRAEATQAAEAARAIVNGRIRYYVETGRLERRDDTAPARYFAKD